MTQYAMSRNCGSVRARALDQFTPAQEFERGLDGALREPGFFRERAQTRRNWFPFRARGAAVEVKINKIRGWLAIMADDVAHENIHDVIVNWNGFAKARHGKSGGGLSVPEASTSCRANSGTQPFHRVRDQRRLAVRCFFLSSVSPKRNFIA